MNVPLTQALQCLKRTSKSWSIIFDPDPRRFLGLQRAGQTNAAYEFRLKLQSGIDLEEYLFQNPLCGGASNIGSGGATNPLDSKWVKILESDPKSQTVRKVLVSVLDKFPSYDLQSEAGSDMAIRDIGSRLSPFASSEDVEENATIIG